MNFYKSIVGRYFMLFAVIPVIIVSIIITIISANVVYKVKVDDTKDMLSGVAKELVYSYELIADGSTGFRQVNGTVFAGDVKVTDDYTIVDRMKEFTGTDLSLFYMDKRIVTTLTNEDGSRYVGTRATEIWNNYVQFGMDYFDENVDINGVGYFGYYIPVHSEDNIIIGMGFAGIPSADINSAIRQLNTAAISACIILCFISLIVCVLVAKRLLRIQNGIMEYLREIDGGNFEHSMEPWLYNRKDEYGMMGRYFVKLNDSLQTLIQRDGLTGLYNRRAAMKFLDNYIVEANCVGGDTFTFAICDIDFFKKVNDTYGHTCGDIVLKTISDILSEVHEDDGFSARWGGEEFIIVFKGGLTESLPRLEDIADRIRNTYVDFEGNKINVTLTFGVAEYKPPTKLDHLISKADILLYQGKDSGRNILVS